MCNDEVKLFEKRYTKYSKKLYNEFFKSSKNIDEVLFNSLKNTSIQILMSYILSTSMFDAIKELRTETRFTVKEKEKIKFFYKKFSEIISLFDIVILKILELTEYKND